MKPKTTKTAARKIAKCARQYGHFAKPGGYVEVSCPQCNERVSAYAGVHGPSVPVALDAEMVDHLQWDCEGAQ